MLNKSKPSRILHVTNTLNRDGVETMLMNYYRNIDKNKFQFDFVVHSNIVGHYDAEVYKLGGEIFHIDSLGSLGFAKYVKELSKIIKNEGPFIAVHSHTEYQGGVVAYTAKKCGIQNRIVHAHSTSWGKANSLANKFTLEFLKFMIKRYANKFCACGNEAATFLFGKKLFRSGKINMIKNIINLEAFKQDPNITKTLQKELNTNGENLVIGHIANFAHEVKNQSFSLRLAKYLKESNVGFKMFFIGDGPLRKSTESLANDLGVKDHTIFLGSRPDISQLVHLLDIILLPSLYEGIPLVLIEAQAAGLACIASNKVPPEIDMDLGLVQHIGLNENLDIWYEAIQQALATKKPEWDESYKAICQNGYDTVSCTNNFMRLYEFS